MHGIPIEARTIYPSFKTALRFACIMAVLFSAIPFYYASRTERLLPFAITSFFATFAAVLGLAYSYRIALSDKRLKIYQIFVKVADFALDDIYDIYFTQIAENGQGCALVVCTNSGGRRTFPVRLFEKDEIATLIADISAASADSSSKPALKKPLLKNFRKLALAVVLLTLPPFLKAIIRHFSQ